MLTKKARNSKSKLKKTGIICKCFSGKNQGAEKGIQMIGELKK